MDIHTTAGGIAEPLTTLGEQLKPEMKETLQNTKQTILEQANLGQRTQWWINTHPVYTVLGAVTLGALTGLSLCASWKRN